MALSSLKAEFPLKHTSLSLAIVCHGQSGKDIVVFTLILSSKDDRFFLINNFQPGKSYHTRFSKLLKWPDITKRPQKIKIAICINIALEVVTVLTIFTVWDFFMLLEMTVCCICTHIPDLLNYRLLCPQIMEIKWHYSICCQLLFVDLWVHHCNKSMYLYHLVQTENCNVISVPLKIVTYGTMYILIISILPV